ncbi:MAG: hypothetical protein ACTSSE_16040 [Candidatus Thorarchaeota archaeon]
MSDFLKQMEEMSAEELVAVYNRAKELLPTKVNPDNFGEIIGAIMGDSNG